MFYYPAKAKLIFPLVFIFQFILILVFGQPKKAQGILGGNIRAFANLNGNVFAGTYGGGVFVSKDKGLTWAPTNGGLTTKYIISIFAAGNTLFVGTWNGGVFRSLDGGLTWSNSSNGMTDPNTIAFTQTDNGVFAATQNGGVFRSTNNGNSWTAQNNGLLDIRATSISSIGNTIYVGTLIGGVFTSIDNGSSWVAINNGLQDLGIRSLIRYKSRLVVSTGVRVYSMMPNINSWLPMDSGLPNATREILFAGSEDLYLAVFQTGLYKFNESNSSWASTNANLKNAFFGAFNQVDNVILVGMQGPGVFRSNDGGLTWSDANSGMTNAAVSCIVSNSTSLFAGVIGTGIYRSDDSGSNWVSVNSGLTNLIVSCLEVSGDKIFAGTGVSSSMYGLGSGVFVSTNNGNQWQPISIGLPTFPVSGLVFLNNYLFVSFAGAGVYRSQDGGATWSPANNGLYNDVRAIAKHANLLFVATSNGLYSSNNYGTTWQIVSTYPEQYIYSLASDGKIVYASNFSKIYASNDNGATWKTIGLPVNSRAISIYASSENLVVLIEGGGSFFSKDNGATWCKDLLNERLDSGIGSALVKGDQALVGTQDGLYLKSFSQTITFQPLKDVTLGASQFNLMASSTSGLPVSFQSKYGKLNITQSIASPISAGRDSINALQLGNGCYNRAKDVKQSLCVSPLKPGISFSLNQQGNPILSTTGDGNQWFFSGSAIPGETSKVLILKEVGNYSVQASVDNCKSQMSDDYPVLILGVKSSNFFLYPNPAYDNLHLTGLENDAMLTISDNFGRLIKQFDVKAVDNFTVEISELKPGIYFLMVKNNQETKRLKFLKK